LFIFVYALHAIGFVKGVSAMTPQQHCNYSDPFQGRKGEVFYFQSFLKCTKEKKRKISIFAVALSPWHTVI
jgi:hypothetical protein